jgi:hypothetical protein
VDAAGKVISQAPVANDEAALRTLVVWAHEHQAVVVVVVDQPGGAAAVLLRLCWQAEVQLGYVHGLAVARARDFYARESKTDPKAVFIEDARPPTSVGRFCPVRVWPLLGSSKLLVKTDPGTRGVGGSGRVGPNLLWSQTRIRRIRGRPSSSRKTDRSEDVLRGSITLSTRERTCLS